MRVHQKRFYGRRNWPAFAETSARVRCNGELYAVWDTDLPCVTWNMQCNHWAILYFDNQTLRKYYSHTHSKWSHHATVVYIASVKGTPRPFRRFITFNKQFPCKPVTPVSPMSGVSRDTTVSTDREEVWVNSATATHGEEYKLSALCVARSLVLWFTTRWHYRGRK